MSSDNESSRLRARLAELADAPAPASPFDPVRTATAGRRRLRAARSSAVGGTGALAVAAVFGIAAAFGPAGPPTPSPGSGIGSDPMAKFMDFGWLPASLPNVSYMASASSGSGDVTAQGDKTPDGAPRVDLQALPDNRPGTATATTRLIPTTLNDGRQAYWVTQSTGGGLLGDFQLRFPAKDGRWFSMAWSVNWGRVGSSKFSGVPESTAKVPPATPPVSKEWQQDLLRMATQVTDTPAQIPMPLRITGLPPDFKPYRTFLWRPGGFGEGAPGTWSALLMFDSGDAMANIDVGPHGTLSPNKSATCKTAAGLDACVEDAGTYPALEHLGGAKGLLDMVTLLGPDEDQWTTDVIVP